MRLKEEETTRDRYQASPTYSDPGVRDLNFRLDRWFFSREAGMLDHSMVKRDQIVRLGRRRGMAPRTCSAVARCVAQGSRPCLGQGKMMP